MKWTEKVDLSMLRVSARQGILLVGKEQDKMERTWRCCQCCRRRKQIKVSTQCRHRLLEETTGVWEQRNYLFLSALEKEHKIFLYWAFFRSSGVSDNISVPSWLLIFPLLLALILLSLYFIILFFLFFYQGFLLSVPFVLGIAIFCLRLEELHA